ncbi:unnamed protein product [Linum trigynum]|uniref:Uncharacterized protein n=1 Tax=Linum trigynum TaxID=586398 RepID=A0AAV2G170_9ROSI
MGLLAQPPPLSTPLPPSLEEPRTESDASLSFSNTASNLATLSPSRFQIRLHATPLCGDSLFLSRSDSARCSLPPATVLSQSRWRREGGLRRDGGGMVAGDLDQERRHPDFLTPPKNP